MQRGRKGKCGDGKETEQKGEVAALTLWLCGPQGNAMRVLVIDLNAIITDSERAFWQSAGPTGNSHPWDRGQEWGAGVGACEARQSFATNYANFSTPPRSTRN